jgi:hypothetical protein
MNWSIQLPIPISLLLTHLTTQSININKDFNFASSNIYNNNTIIIYLTATRQQPGGSGYYEYT